MAITIPSGCYRQPTESKGVDASGNFHFNYVLKGPYSSLDSLASSISQGDEVISGWYASSQDLQMGPGNTGTLTISCVPSPVSEGQTPEALPLKEVWSLRSVRNDVSIMGYCGPGASNPKRALVEGWMKEPDGKLADDLKFRKPDGTIEDLSLDSPTCALIEKIRKGYESVMRFYPVLTCTRTYSTFPPGCLENLSFIDTPRTPGANAKQPTGLAVKVALYEWVKVQDDADEGTDGKWRRIESWMGIKKTDAADGAHPWDADLYGPSRWGMPYAHGGNGNGGGAS